MSRTKAILFASLMSLSAPVSAQDAYGPAQESEVEEDAPDPLTNARPCETETQEDGVILVCRELDDQERYRSPIPRQVESDRTIIPGLTDPPCWVTNPESVGTLSCMRVGWAPEPAIMVDLSIYPEPLSSEDAELVSRAEPDGEMPRPAIGERVAIDLSEDD